MANKLIYGSRTFTDDDVKSGSLVLSNSMMFDTLAADELNIEIFSDELGNKKLLTNTLQWYSTSSGAGYVVAMGDIRKYKYGDPIDYYYNNQLFGKYYIKNIVRVKTNRFKINAISAVGLWISTQHKGGIYEGTTAGTLIRELVGSVPVTIDTDVAAVKIYGHLPIASSRDNLAQVLFAIGASIVKNSNGSPRFRFLQNISAVQISDDDIYIDDGSVDYLTPATNVQLTEHSYYQSVLDSEVTLFDNTNGTGSVTAEMIAFQNPCYDLKWNGSSLPSSWESGANYAIVTGTGNLTGKEYTHTTKVFTVETGQTGETNVEKIEDKTLVSLANSANVAARVSDYKAQTESVEMGMVLSANGIRPGSLIRFTDPFGDASEGFVSDMDINISGILKSNTKVIKNYVPSHFGNNYESSQMFTANGTWTVPSGVEVVRLVIGQGGQAGQNGTNGGASWSVPGTNPDDGAGEGGVAGLCGSAGKVFVVDVRNPSGTFTITVGQGGQPAEGSGALGNYGTHSTVTNNGTTYTSDSGVVMEEGYRDIMSGRTLAVTGENGINGGTGRNYNDITGGSVTYGEQTWTAGANKNNEWIHYDGDTRKVESCGSYGSGAAYGANGIDGNPPTYRDQAGNAPNGADAISYNVSIELSSAGWGGHGGGGAGAPGYTKDKRYYSSSGWVTNWYFGSNGRGGYHSKGTPGGNGFVLIYY